MLCLILSFRGSFLELLKKVVAFIVDNDKSWPVSRNRC